MTLGISFDMSILVNCFYGGKQRFTSQEFGFTGIEFSLNQVCNDES